MKKKLGFLLMLVMAIIAAAGIFIVTRRNDLISANVEALSNTEINDDICTSPKTWLGLGRCMNVSTVICKDNSGNCD